MTGGTGLGARRKIVNANDSGTESHCFSPPGRLLVFTAFGTAAERECTLASSCPPVPPCTTFLSLGEGSEVTASVLIKSIGRCSTYSVPYHASHRRQRPRAFAHRVPNGQLYVPTKLQDMQRSIPVVPPLVTDTVQTADPASLVITLA